MKSRRLQIKGEDFSTDMSSDELEPFNGLILTTLQQSTAKIHVNNNGTMRNSNRRTQSNIEEGISLDSSTYPSLFRCSDEDQRRAYRNNDNSSTMAKPDTVIRTGKRECSILYDWLEQRNSRTGNNVNKKEFETVSRQNMSFPDELKA
ncbi:MAG: hypothetical protein EZS28_023194 [Streblomastix strix]|uniref:Uncharacterized protein n=1 Tax=Streblomastix strix TaxID=222440 RepID=A0A5J4VFD6_9EUKA|nr:MAG: hypothetical protein EZS28_023194 [Streblomastix strix]